MRRTGERDDTRAEKLSADANDAGKRTAGDMCPAAHRESSWISRMCLRSPRRLLTPLLVGLGLTAGPAGASSGTLSWHAPLNVLFPAPGLGSVSCAGGSAAPFCLMTNGGTTDSATHHWWWARVIGSTWITRADSGGLENNAIGSTNQIVSCYATSSSNKCVMLFPTYSGGSVDNAQVAIGPPFASSLEQVSTSPGVSLVSLSCPSSSFCMTLDRSAGDAFVNTNPPGYSATSAWSSAGQVNSSLLCSVSNEICDPGPSVSCVSSTFCMAAGNGYAQEFSGSGSWQAPVSNGIGTCLCAPGPQYGYDIFDEVSCASTTFCVDIGDVNEGSVTTQSQDYAVWNGTTWSAPEPLPTLFTIAGVNYPMYPDDISCVPSTTTCVTIGDGAAWTFDGTSWSAPEYLAGNVPPQPGNVNTALPTDPLSSVSCASTAYCVATDWNGNAIATFSSFEPPQGAALFQYEQMGGMNLNEICALCQSLQKSAVDPINTATGDFHQTLSDVSVAGAGVPLSFLRTYSSDVGQQEEQTGVAPGTLGYGWSYNLGMSVAADPYSGAPAGAVVVTNENGSQSEFDPYVSGSSPSWCSSSYDFCPNAPRVLATLNHNSDGTWTMARDVQGTTTFTFNSSGALTSLSDAAGDSLTASSGTPGTTPGCSSSAATCTVWTSSASGRSLALSFSALGMLTEVQGVDSSGTVLSSASYCYYAMSCANGATHGSSENLYSVTTSAGTTTYDYNPTNPVADLVNDLQKVTYPDGSTLTNSYDNTTDSTSGFALSQTDRSGSTTTLTYTGDNMSSAGGSTSVTNSVTGQTTTYAYTDGIITSDTKGTGSSV